ncbi:Gamma-1-syntrophin [Chelonia mydas]|uniref:Gamma-1-syntrophin n=1 Tax=Chelonia mydas TaxID=8469 RepID=M7BFG7_CHEMY|nr:Gamma-1-syntrophin [Chelonia mydas]
MGDRQQLTHRSEDTTLLRLSRQNAFQIIAVDGVCSGIIQSLSAEDCMDWLQAIATNISNLTKHNVSIDQSGSVDFQIIFDHRYCKMSYRFKHRIICS